VSAAIRLAQQITANSPDAVQSTKHGLLLSQRLNHGETVINHAWSSQSKRVYKGKNIKEGLKAFTEVRNMNYTWISNIGCHLTIIIAETRSSLDKSLKTLSCGEKGSGCHRVEYMSECQPLGTLYI